MLPNGLRYDGKRENEVSLPSENVLNVPSRNVHGLTVAQGGATHFDLGVYANRRESLGQGTAEHGVGGQLTARW